MGARHALALLFGLACATGGPAAPSGAGLLQPVHLCNQLTLAVDTLCPGITVETTCLKALNACRKDTFYRDTLANRLIREFREKRYSIIGMVDSVHTRFYNDSFPSGTDTIIVPMQTESVWVEVQHVLKGEIPETRLFFVDTRGNNIYDTVTYRVMVDTPFVASFDEYGDLFSMGIMPTIDCYYEPTAFLITDKGVERRGKSVRLPGISVPLREFLQRAGYAGEAWKDYPEREWGARLRILNGTDTARARLGPGPLQGSAFNLAGRRMQRRAWSGDAAEMEAPGPAGTYVLDFRGRKWNQQGKLVTAPGLPPAVTLEKRKGPYPGSCRE